MKRIIALCLTILMLLVPMSAFNLEANALVGAGAPSATNPEMILGIDLSYWNVGQNALDYSRVNFAELKADGVKFVILRLGYETSTTSGIKIDPSFNEFYKRARAAGLDLGVYLYSYALTYNAAKNDAQEVINYIENNGMYFEYPIYLDMETTAQTSASASTMESICLGWCELLESKGYYPAIYSAYWVFNSLSSSFKSRYDFWVPAYKSNNYYDAQYTYTSQPSVLGGKPYAKGYCMWQYSCCNYYNGNYVYKGVYTGTGARNTSLDLNVCYKDYPTIIKNNGYNNCAPAESAAKKALREIINSTWNIDYNDYSVNALEAIRMAEYEGTQLLNNEASTDAQFETQYNKIKNAINAKTVALSANKPYTTTAPTRNDAYADDGKRLTDGQKGYFDGGSLSDGASIGRYAGWNNKVEITVDLGTSQYSNTYTAYLAAGQWGVLKPKKNLFNLEVYVSNNPLNGFTYVGSTNDIVVVEGSNIEEQGWTNYTITLTSASSKNGRYVKFVITNSDCDGDIWLDEVEVTMGGGSIASGVYLSGINEKILSGDCHIFTPAFGTITTSTANHAYTKNVVAQYNSTLGKYVVVSITEGTGTSTPDITLASDQILIACHCWEGDGITDPVAGSLENFNTLGRANVGDVIEMSGVNTQYSFLTAGAHIFFHGATPLVEDGVPSHTPGEATSCDDPVCCTKCGQQISESAGHTEGEWETLADGTKVKKCTVCGEVLETEGGSDPVDLRGDINLDGAVDIFDYLTVKSIYMSSYNADEETFARADVNADASVDVFDYLIIKSLCF